MQIQADKIRFALPSKGRMGTATIDFLKECGFKIKRKNREYMGTIPLFPQIQVIFQNQMDIIRGVEGGSLSFGIVGYDLVQEFVNLYSSEVLVIHNNLEFGECQLELAIPEEMNENSIDELFTTLKNLRIATKFPKSTSRFLSKFAGKFQLIEGKGALEVYPALDYSDVIVDLVSSGETLRANRLKQINGGTILKSQAVFIGNRSSLENPEVLRIARDLLEYFEAFLRGRKFVQVFANVRESNPEILSQKLFTQPQLTGLQGPTISPIYTRNGSNWNAVHIIVERSKLQEVIRGLRSIGGSGVIVSPTLYIFEEEPECYKRLLLELNGEGER